MPIPTSTAQSPTPLHAPSRTLAKAPSASVGLVFGSLFLAVAAAAAAMLVAHRLGGLAIPGCGAGGACDKVANGPWGKVPWLLWPVSYVGAAYFIGMLVAWIGVRGNPTNGMRWLARLGALASLMFLGVMFSDGTICPYCVAAHGANLLFVVMVEMTARGGAGAPVPARGGASVAVVVGAIATAVLGMAELRLHEQNKNSLNESIALAQKGMNPAPTGPTKPTTVPIPGAGVQKPGGFTGRYRLGPDNAPIRIVMFTDYQCPDCKHFEGQAMALLKEHPNVSLSIKHFPFCTACNNTPNTPNLHPNACWAARAAEAAGKLYGPSGFWKMHSWLFEHAGVFDDQTFPPALESLGFEPVRFQQVMKEMDTLALVQEDIKEANGLGIKATPMMFVNAVEIKGWGSNANALRDTVEALAAHAPAMGSAATDRPATAEEKNAEEANQIIADWMDTKKTPAMAWPIRKQSWADIPESAPVKVTLWGDLLEPNCALADKTIREAQAGRGDIRYEFRYFPFDQSCNPGLPRTVFPQGCRAAKAAEAAGQLGGNPMYWKMHMWIMEHQKEFSDAALRAAAPAMGLNAEALLQKMDSQDVKDIIANDAGLGFRIGIPEIPRIFINGKLVPRWNIPNQFVIERLIEIALKPPTPAH